MTTIQRQYSLPNCRLILQGVGSDADPSGRPLMSMVTDVECYLAGQKTPLSGGRAFLESLTATVSNYAQSYLSGIQLLLRRDQREKTGLVQLEQVGDNLHRLRVRPEDQADGATEIDLTTVQLFDLVEAVDQFFADAQTLPELGLSLDPISKRHIKAAEPLAKRAGPAVLGASGLAAAAALLFMLPAPQVKRPETSSAGTTTEQPTASPSASPEAGTRSPSSAASPEAASPPATGTPSAATGSAATASAGLNLANTAEITDPAALDRLTTQLYNKLDAEWQKKPSFEGELIYRVGVSSEGQIVGYRYGNDAALTYLNEIPLADVQFATPSEETSPSASPSTSPIAQFRVLFKSDGVLEISPWAGQPDASPAPAP